MIFRYYCTIKHSKLFSKLFIITYFGRKHFLQFSVSTSLWMKGDSRTLTFILTVHARKANI